MPPKPRVPTATDRRALQPYLRVQRAVDTDVNVILNRASKDADRMLRRLNADSMRARQLRQFQKEAEAIQRQLWADLGTVVKEGRGSAAAAAVDSSSVYDDKLFRAAGLKPKEITIIKDSLKAQARAGVTTAQARLALSQQDLSARVYKARDLMNGRVDRVINSAITRGLSADEFAKEIRPLIRSTVQGGVRNAAMRLARTELNNAFHAQQVLLATQQPWVTGVRWNLSSSHPLPDECDDYAGTAHVRGGERGVYKPGDVPKKPHPQCLCFLTNEMIDSQDFVAGMLSGKFDNYLAAL